MAFPWTFLSKDWSGIKTQKQASLFHFVTTLGIPESVFHVASGLALLPSSGLQYSSLAGILSILYKQTSISESVSRKPNLRQWSSMWESTWMQDGSRWTFVLQTYIHVKSKNWARWQRPRCTQSYIISSCSSGDRRLSGWSLPWRTRMLLNNY